MRRPRLQREAEWRLSYGSFQWKGRQRCALDLCKGKAEFRKEGFRKRAATNEHLAHAGDLSSRDQPASLARWETSARLHLGRGCVRQRRRVVQDGQRQLFRSVHCDEIGATDFRFVVVRLCLKVEIPSTGV